MIFGFKNFFFQSEFSENSPDFNKIQNKNFKNYKDNLTVENRRGSIVDLKENFQDFSILPIRKNNLNKCTCNLHQISYRRVDTISGTIHQAASEGEKKLWKNKNYGHSYKNVRPREFKPSRLIRSNKNEQINSVSFVKIKKIKSNNKFRIMTSN